MEKHAAHELFQELQEELERADKAFLDYQGAREDFDEARLEKYEKIQLENGQTVLIPLEKYLDDLAQIEVETGRFQSKLNGRTTKDERKAELTQYMASIPEWQELSTQFQMATINEASYKITYETAKENYSRIHTKIMALRGQVEFLKEHEQVLVKMHEEILIKEQYREELNLVQVSQENLEYKNHLMSIRRDVEELALQRVQEEIRLEEFRQAKELTQAKAEVAAKFEKDMDAVYPILEFAQQLQTFMAARVDLPDNEETVSTD